jgi:4-diphosphocytidyl-2-C-methyl-D-erythritol kinase
MMIIVNNMESISVLSNAKINLFFSIDGINPDHFCAITSIMAPLAFGDDMVFSIEKNTSSPKPIIEIFQHSPLKFPPKNNTLIQAVEQFCERTGIDNFSLRVDIEKKIPIGGGWGGGSSNGVFTLKALNRFHNAPLSEEQCISLAQKIGTDCPFFIKNLPQQATGRGEIVSPISMNFCQNLTNYSALIFCPHFSISTEDAYKKFKQKPRPICDASMKVKKIFAEDHFESLLFNSFQQQILDEHAELKILFNDLYHLGYFPHITGSGSGCFILHRQCDILEKVQKIILKKLGPIPLCKIVHFL